MSALPTAIFNTQRDYNDRSLFLGPEPGLFDTVNKHHPEIDALYKELKSMDWDENEFDYSNCNAEFKTCDRSTYDMMLKTLAFQWETDSVAARSIIGVMAPMITSSELSGAWTLVSANEVVHARTYSEIVRQSFDDPRKVLDDILSVVESLQRMQAVSMIMGDAHRVAHEYALGLRKNDQETYNAAFMFTIALFLMERIQFMASFAVTFKICDAGLFPPIGKAVQKIAQDELEVHVELDKAVLKNELLTERGRVAFETQRELILQAIQEVVDSELAWVDYLFSEGRQLVGMTADLLKQWVLYNAKDVYSFLGLPAPYTLPERNPLPYMSKWLNISNNQPSPQEEQVGQYRVNIIRRNDDNEVFDMDF